MTIHKPQAYGAVLRAIAQVGFSDITIVGYPSKDNHGFPSKTHINGINGDFRYLRMDKSGRPFYIDNSPIDFDIKRQEKFIESLSKFGWPLFYSYDYELGGSKKILPKSKSLKGHNNHLHSIKFKANFKK